MSRIQKSPALLAAERELAKLEASIAAENAKRDGAHRAHLDKLRENDALRAASKLNPTPIAVHEASSLPPPMSIPPPMHIPPSMSPPRLPPGTPRAPMLPPTGATDLPEPCLMLLRELWRRLGYEGNQFVDMQMEIARELERADFARFEREMLSNEVLMLRKEVNTLNTERLELIRRCDAAKQDLNQLVAAEEKTYQALIAERESAQRHLAEVEEAVQMASNDADKEAAKVTMLNEEMARLEKERLAAIQYAKRMEEEAKRAEHEAFIASTRPPQKVAVPVEVPVKVPVKVPVPVPVPVHARRTNQPPPNHGGYAQGLDTSVGGWSKADEEALKAKIAERKLAAEEARIAAEEKRLAQEKLKMALQRERLATPGPTRGDDYRGEPMRDAFSHEGQFWPGEGGNGTRSRKNSLGSTLGQTGSGDWATGPGNSRWREPSMPGGWTDSGTGRGRNDSGWGRNEDSWATTGRVAHPGLRTPGHRNVASAKRG